MSGSSETANLAKFALAQLARRDNRRDEQPLLSELAEERRESSQKIDQLELQVYEKRQEK